MASRAALFFEPPAPVRGTGPCRADKVHSLSRFCGERADRRVVVGLAPAVNVCLWHSLTACTQLGAYLVRSP